MFHFRKYVIRHKTFFLSIGFLAIFATTVSYATPPTSPYNAGETLDPQCTPGSTNCSVAISSGGGTGYIQNQTAVPQTASFNITGSAIFTGSELLNISSNQIMFNRATTSSYIDQAGIGGSIRFRTSNASTQDTTAMTILANGNVGIGTISPAAKTEILSTTEQLRLSYDPTKYASFTINPSDGLNITTTGSGNINLLPGGGVLNISGGIVTSGANTTLYIPSVYGATSTVSTVHQFGGSTTNFLRAAFYGNGTATLTPNANYSGTLFASTSVTTAATGTHGMLATVAVNPLEPVISGGASIANTAVLYVGAAGTAGTNNYSIYSVSGNNYFGGNVGIGKINPAVALDITGALNTSLDSSIHGLSIGQGAGNIATNTALGFTALAGNTTGGLNTAVGYQTLSVNGAGIQNTAVGYQALMNNTGSQNTAVGRWAMLSNTTGTLNTATGLNALRFNTTGFNNVAMGYNSLTSNVGGQSNTALGGSSMSLNNSGTYNTAVGSASLFSNTTGSYNTGLGFRSMYNNTGSYNIVIGAGVDTVVSSGSAQLNVGNVLYGTGMYQGGLVQSSTPTVDGRIGIGVTTPQSTLDVNGQIQGKNVNITGTVGGSSLTAPTNLQLAILQDPSYEYAPDPIDFGYTVYSYKIVSGIKMFSAASASYFSSQISGPNYAVQVSWNPVLGADGYRIIPTRNTPYNYQGNVGYDTTNTSFIDGDGSMTYSTNPADVRVTPKFASYSNENILNGNLTVGGDINASGNMTLVNLSIYGTASFGGNQVSGVVAHFQNSTGSCDIDPTNSSLVCSSDMTLKKNEELLSDGSSWNFNSNISFDNQTVLGKILALRPVQYNWNSESDTATKHPGFIAQEVEQVFPQLVATDAKTGLKSLNYTGMIPFTIQAIQDMNLNITDISNLDRHNTWRDSLIAWFGSATNGIKSLVVHDKVCINETCVTEAQLKQLLNQQNNGGGSTTVINPPAAQDETKGTNPTDEKKDDKENPPADEPVIKEPIVQPVKTETPIEVPIVPVTPVEKID